MPPSGSPPLLHQTKPSGRILWATNGFPLTRNGIDNTVFCDHPQGSYYEPGCRYGHGPFSSVTERNHESRPMCVSSLIAAKGPGLCMSEFDCSCWSQSMHIRVLSQLWVPAVEALGPGPCVSDYNPAMGPGPCVSDYNPCNGSRPMCISVLSQLWVTARAYQSTTPAMGPGPCVSGFYRSFQVPVHAYQTTTLALCPSPHVSGLYHSFGSQPGHIRLQP